MSGGEFGAHETACLAQTLRWHLDSQMISLQMVVRLQLGTWYCCGPRACEAEHCDRAEVCTWGQV